MITPESQRLIIRPTSIAEKFRIIKASFNQSLIVWKAYKGALVFFIILSIIMAALPILIGRYVGGENFISNFSANGGGEHPEAFLLLGTSSWTLITFGLWDYATYIREEQQQGTFESLFLTPANQYLIILGRGALSALMSIGTFLVGLIIGLLIFDPDLLFSIDIFPFSLAILFLLFGFIPILGLALSIGALVIRFKEINNVIGVLQFLFGTLMGVFFPIALLGVVQIFSVLFPGTWMVQNVRYVVAGSPPMMTYLGLTGSSIENFYVPILFDLVVVGLLALVWAIIGWAVFSRTLGNLKRNEGISQY